MIQDLVINKRNPLLKFLQFYFRAISWLMVFFSASFAIFILYPNLFNSLKKLPDEKAYIVEKLSLTISHYLYFSIYLITLILSYFIYREIWLALRRIIDSGKFVAAFKKVKVLAYFFLGSFFCETLLYFIWLLDTDVLEKNIKQMHAYEYNFVPGGDLLIVDFGTGAINLLYFLALIFVDKIVNTAPESST